MHGIENQDSHARMSVNSQCMQPLCLPAICICGCFVNGVCIQGLAVVEALFCGGLRGFTGISV